MPTTERHTCWAWDVEAETNYELHAVAAAVAFKCARAGAVQADVLVSGPKLFRE